jgi:nucleoside-diphosphate-sugar epimerase
MNEQVINSVDYKSSTVDILSPKLFNITKCKTREGVLVTGGAGFIGSHVAEALLRRYKKVVVFDVFNQETTKSDEKHDNVMVLRKVVKEVNEKITDNFLKAELYVIVGDIRDRFSIDEIIFNPFYNITSAIHTAGMVDYRRSVSCSNEYFDINIKGTATLLDVLGRSGKIKRIVQASSCSVYGEVNDQSTKLVEDSVRKPINPYDISKVASDAVAHCYSQMYQMQVFIIRIASCYGHRGRPNMLLPNLMEHIENGEPIKINGNGEVTRTWLYIDDIVDCFMKAFFYGLRESNLADVVSMNVPSLSLYEEFNTGSQEGAVSMNRVIEIAEKVVGKKANIQLIKEVPKGEAKLSGLLDYGKAKRVLGWQPLYNLEQGMTVLKKYYSDANIEKRNS